MLDGSLRELQKLQDKKIHKAYLISSKLSDSTSQH